MNTGLAATSPQRILIVRPSALGDVSRTVPALVTLRRTHPQAKIDWLVHEEFAPVIRHHPDLGAVIGFARGRFGRMWRDPRILADAWAWARDLRRRRYDLVFDLQGLMRSGLLTRLTGAAQRVGYANARELGYLGYNRRHHVDPALHTVERMLALLAAEGYQPQRDMRLYVGADDQRWLDQLHEQHSIRDDQYLVLAPTARWRCKCWPIENYITLARRLLDHPHFGRPILVLTHPRERDQVQPMIDALAADQRVVFLGTTVGQMMAALSRTRLLVCNDSAALHVAVGFQRAIVAIFGPTDPALVGPYQRPDTVVRPEGVERLGPVNYRAHGHDQSLIARVRVEQVWQKMLEQLAAAPAK